MSDFSTLREQHVLILFEKAAFIDIENMAFFSVLRKRLSKLLFAEFSAKLIDSTKHKTVD